METFKARTIIISGSSVRVSKEDAPKVDYTGAQSMTMYATLNEMHNKVLDRFKREAIMVSNPEDLPIAPGDYPWYDSDKDELLDGIYSVEGKGIVYEVRDTCACHDKEGKKIGFCFYCNDNKPRAFLSFSKEAEEESAKQPEQKEPIGKTEFVVKTIVHENGKMFVSKLDNPWPKNELKSVPEGEPDPDHDEYVLRVAEFRNSLKEVSNPELIESYLEIAFGRPFTAGFQNGTTTPPEGLIYRLDLKPTGVDSSKPVAVLSFTKPSESHQGSDSEKPDFREMAIDILSLRYKQGYVRERMATGSYPNDWDTAIEMQVIMASRIWNIKNKQQ